MGKKYVPGQFAAEVDEWVLKSKKRLLYVFLEAVQRVISTMQEVGPSKARGGSGSGRMPVDTGFLRASLVVEINSLTARQTVNESSVGSYSYNDSQVSLIILAAKLGDSIYAVYTAVYARRLEYGFSGTDSRGVSVDQEGYGFVSGAASQWRAIVNQVVREAKARR